jgi:branched-chain amino acid transport system substrate-binding protein
MKNVLKKLIIPMSLMLVLAGCATIDEAEETPVGEEVTAVTSVCDTEGVSTVQIGGLSPLSGDGAVYGIPVQRVAEIALAEINVKGILDGQCFDIIWEDGGCNSDMANRATQKLIDVSNVDVIYGGFCSSETLAAAPLTEAAKVILLSPGSSSPDVTNAGDFVFRNYPSDSTQGKVLAEYAADQGFKKIGMIAEQQDYTLGISKVFESEFEGEVVTETYLPDASDFRTQILKLKNAGIDAIFVNPQTAPKADIIFKQLQEQGVDLPVLLNDVAIGLQENVTNHADFLEGAVGAETTYDREGAGFKALSERYMKDFDAELPYPTYMTTGYDAVYLLKDAIESAGDTANTELIRDYLYGVSGRPGLSGSLTIDENGDPLSGHKLRTVRDGAVEDL